MRRHKHGAIILLRRLIEVDGFGNLVAIDQYGHAVPPDSVRVKTMCGLDSKMAAPGSVLLVELAYSA
jgi:hypothetical protein